MARLIVDAEVIIAQFKKSPNEMNISPAVAVSVARDDGQPVKGLGNSKFRVCAIVPPPIAPKFKAYGVFEVQEQKPGLYVLSLIFPKVPPPLGKYIFAVTVTDQKDRGETLATLHIN